jgi:hypothetical protein
MVGSHEYALTICKDGLATECVGYCGSYIY